MLTTQEKQKIIAKVTKGTDTGSYEAQVALLSERIKQLATHLKEHKKDNSSRRGLLKLVNKRKRLLSTLEEKDEERYQALVKKLKI